MADHRASEEEMMDMSSIDFVLPLKQVGLITRSVLEAVWEFYKPRRIIVVTRRAEGEILRRLSPFWNVGSVVECVDEETFFMPNFNLTLDRIISEYDETRPGDKREAGWWLQQLIKLGAATQIPNISPVYVVWDGDLVPVRRWRLCSRDEESRQLRYHIAILQGESRSEFNTTQYANCMEYLTGLRPLEPKGGGTFVAHHMVFQARYVKEMLDLMAEKTGSSEPWPLMLMASSRKFYRFSEYKTYATFMLTRHPEEFHYHDLSQFGAGGLRFREANEIIGDMLQACKIENGGMPYPKVRGYVGRNWGASTASSEGMPAYIQLDHVYGLEGIDLNMTAVDEHDVASASGLASASSSSSTSSVSSSSTGTGTDSTAVVVAIASPAAFTFFSSSSSAASKSTAVAAFAAASTAASSAMATLNRLFVDVDAPPLPLPSQPRAPHTPSSSSCGVDGKARSRTPSSTRGGLRVHHPNTPTQGLSQQKRHASPLALVVAVVAAAVVDAPPSSPHSLVPAKRPFCVSVA